ncbi:MAG: hypothetical protein LDL41_03750 [Coleofasciculus sp. S288]|nr:hypothetical protein [Coleofasciculus sp. S288]
MQNNEQPMLFTELSSEAAATINGGLKKFWKKFLKGLGIVASLGIAAAFVGGASGTSRCATDEDGITRCQRNP